MVTPRSRAEGCSPELTDNTVSENGAGVVGDGQSVPHLRRTKDYALSPNYPNPFNPTTTVALDVPPPGGRIQVRIYNVSGRLVKTLLSARRTPGRYELTWDGSDDRGESVASGIYFLDMIAPEFHSTRKLVLVK